MCVSKHGFSRHSQALLGQRLQAGRGTRGSRRSPNSVGKSREEAWPGCLGPRPVLGYIGPSPLEFLWRSYNYMHVSVCPFRWCAPPVGSWLGSSAIPPAASPHMLGRAPAGQLWTLRAKPLAQGWEWSRWVGEISQDSLLRDSLRVASQPEGLQGCGLGNRQWQPAAPLPGLKAASCCIWRAGFGKSQPSVVS